MPTTTLKNAEKIFMLGIGGAGMRALAALLHEDGITVSGTDAAQSSLQHDPALAGFRLVAEADAKDDVAAADLVIRTDAVPPDHPLCQQAQQANIPVLAYHEAVGEYARDFTTVAVAGTHGKSSTTAMLAHLCQSAGLDPTVIVGAPIPAWDNRNARRGTSHLLIIEADEYRRHFLSLQPHHLIVTTIDFDHPDYFRDVSDVEHAFAQLLQQLQGPRTVVTTSQVLAAHRHLAWPAETIAVDPPTDQFPLPLPGSHMQHNAALALNMAAALGVSPAEARRHLATFTGLGRRFEYLGTINDTRIISDYGHHPAEIAATLQAARQHYPHHTLIVIVEPHTTERLTSLFDEFVASLTDLPDQIFITDPYEARRTPARSDAKTTADLVASLKASGKSARYLASAAELPAHLAQHAGAPTIALLFTAGELDGQVRRLIVATET